MVCTTARRPRHDNNVTRAQQDRDWRNVARETTDEEDCGVSEAGNGPQLVDGKRKGGEAHEIETRGEVAQISERST